MDDNDTPFMPHGGYRRLRSYAVAQAVYDATVVFCRRFYAHDKRMTDQMVQAARSGVRNISEGSGAAATSRKSEIKLTNVALSSLNDELIHDFESYLLQNGLRVWPKDSREALVVRKRLQHDRVENLPPPPPGGVRLTGLADLADFVRKTDAETAANTLFCATHQACYLLRRQVESQGRTFVEEGGFTENLYKKRLQARGQGPKGPGKVGRGQAKVDRVGPGRTTSDRVRQSRTRRMTHHDHGYQRIRPGKPDRHSDDRPAAGRRYLIQHSAGSGKSNSIAWLAHQLIGLTKASDGVGQGRTLSDCFNAIHRKGIDMARYSLLLMPVMVAVCTATAAADTVYMANGIKIGEVTPDAAIVWTRLTRSAERNVSGAAFPEVAGKERAGGDLSVMEITGGRTLEDMEGATPGAPGLVRVTYWPEDAPEYKVESDWRAVDENRDCTCPFPLTGLTAHTRYVVLAEGKPAADGEPACRVEGRFHTAPLPEDAAEINFVVVTCGDYPRRDDPDKGHKIYDAMLKLDPDFFVHTGDIEYYDKALPWGPAPELARFKWNRFYAMPFQRAFHRSVASYFMKDDHDTLQNDCWPGQHYGALTWEQGLAIFREQVPMGERTYRTFRWGKDLQVWLVEGRDFRSPNSMPDGPDKSIWGAEQKAWFKRTVQESDATFRVLISPTPVVGPDRDNKNDNHANAGFSNEGNELRRFMASMKNMIVINGDRHWQYVSVDEETGLREFGTGPHSNGHASGWNQKDVRPEHRYLKVQGGFLQVTIVRKEGTPEMTLRHRDVDGNICNEVVLPER